MRIYDQELGVPLHEFVFAVFMKGTGFNVKDADHNSDNYDGYMSGKRIMIAAYKFDPEVEGTSMDNHLNVLMRVAHGLWSNVASEEKKLKFLLMMEQRKRDAAQRRINELTGQLTALGPRLVKDDDGGQAA